MSTAIVGSAGYLVGMRLGKQIDSHDHVVRINSGYEICKVAPEDYGKRTTICYVTPAVYRNNPQDAWPQGARIQTKKHVKTQWTMEYGLYESNSGILALVQYALEGHRIFLTGFDFYSGLTGGIIQPPVMGARDVQKDNHEALAKVYGPGYKPGLGTDENKGVARHRGGLRDFKILVRLLHKGYPVTMDDHLEKIVAENMYQINLNEL